MDSLRPDETIEQLLAGFMADHATHLSPNAYRRYAVIVDLFESYLERYRPGLWRGEFPATARRDAGTFCGVFGATAHVRGFSTFLGDYLPHELGVSVETLRTARVVIKAFRAWLAANGSLGGGSKARKRFDQGSRDRPAIQDKPELFPD